MCTVWSTWLGLSLQGWSKEGSVSQLDNRSDDRRPAGKAVAPDIARQGDSQDIRADGAQMTFTTQLAILNGLASEGHRPTCSPKYESPDEAGPSVISPGFCSSHSSQSGSTPVHRYTGSLTKLGGTAARTALDHLEPYLGKYDSRPGTPKGRRTAALPEVFDNPESTSPDPVTMGILSEADAMYLFNL
jgi:hypothetical protein